MRTASAAAVDNENVRFGFRESPTDLPVPGVNVMNAFINLARNVEDSRVKNFEEKLRFHPEHFRSRSVSFR